MEIKKSTFYGIFIITIVVGLGFVMIKPGSSSGNVVTGAVVGVGNDGAQEIVLGMKNYNYFPASYTVNAGEPVKLSADDSVYGCFRDVVIQGTNIRKYLRGPSDSLEFTIDNPGTYTFACSMGMGSGKLIVQ